MLEDDGSAWGVLFKMACQPVCLLKGSGDLDPDATILQGKICHLRNDQAWIFVGVVLFRRNLVYFGVKLKLMDKKHFTLLLPPRRKLCKC